MDNHRDMQFVAAMHKAPCGVVAPEVRSLPPPGAVARPVRRLGKRLVHTGAPLCSLPDEKEVRTMNTS